MPLIPHYVTEIGPTQFDRGLIARGATMRLMISFRAQHPTWWCSTGADCTVNGNKDIPDDVGCCKCSQWARSPGGPEFSSWTLFFGSGRKQGSCKSVTYNPISWLVELGCWLVQDDDRWHAINLVTYCAGSGRPDRACPIGRGNGPGCPIAIAISSITPHQGTTLIFLRITNLDTETQNTNTKTQPLSCPGTSRAQA